MSLTGHIQLVTALVVSAESWNELSDENKAIVRNLAVENGRFASGLTIELGKEAMVKVAETGVEIHEVDLGPFKQAVSGVYSLLNLESEAQIVQDVLAN